jgi:hypothetical protein
VVFGASSAENHLSCSSSLSAIVTVLPFREAGKNGTEHQPGTADTIFFDRHGDALWKSELRKITTALHPNA